MRECAHSEGLRDQAKRNIFSKGLENKNVAVLSVFPVQKYAWDLALVNIINLRALRFIQNFCNMSVILVAVNKFSVTEKCDRFFSIRY